MLGQPAAQKSGSYPGALEFRGPLQGYVPEARMVLLLQPLFTPLPLATDTEAGLWLQQHSMPIHIISQTRLASSNNDRMMPSPGTSYKSAPG